MFQPSSDMRTAKSAGSPAFLPPELCGKHGDVSGQAADIWSMGVSLYCLKYGRIPFNRESMMQMYDAIKNDEPTLPENENLMLSDLFCKIFEKDPEKRIQMHDLRVGDSSEDLGNMLTLAESPLGDQQWYGRLASC